MNPVYAWAISLGSMLIWLAIPFRQRKSFYFYFFLVLGLSDPAGYAFNYIFRIPVLIIYIVASVLSLVFLLQILTIKKYLPFIIAGGLMLIATCYLYIDHGAVEFVFLVTHILILIRLSYLLISFVAKNQAISLFNVALIFYEGIVISKFVNNFAQFADAIFFFIFSTGVQIVVGLFFLIFKEQDHRIVFQLK